MYAIENSFLTAREQRRFPGRESAQNTVHLSMILLVAQRFDGIEERRFTRGIVAEEHAY